MPPSAPVPSQANFVLARLGEKGPAVASALEVSGYRVRLFRGGRLDGALRISCPRSQVALDGLLSALGVSARSLDAMVWAAREAGANGAKLTGAGGGGCIVALDATDTTETALAYTPDCEEVFRAELDTGGVIRVE